METGSGVILNSMSLDSGEEALQFHDLDKRTLSIVIRNNKTGVSKHFVHNFCDPYEQLQHELQEVFPDEFDNI